MQPSAVMLGDVWETVATDPVAAVGGSRDRRRLAVLRERVAVLNPPMLRVP
jgi:hypothetical protein